MHILTHYKKKYFANKNKYILHDIQVQQCEPSRNNLNKHKSQYKIFLMHLPILNNRNLFLYHFLLGVHIKFNSFCTEYTINDRINLP